MMFLKVTANIATVPVAGHGHSTIIIALAVNWYTEMTFNEFEVFKLFYDKLIKYYNIKNDLLFATDLESFCWVIFLAKL